MNLHEYQAKKLFVEYGIPVPPGKLAHSVKEALRNAAELKGEGWVVKAQVHAGGRGKAGGVKLAHSMGELEDIVRNMLGKQLVTKQSAPTGQPVNCVLVQSMAAIAAEYYLGLVVDRASKRIAIIASSAGGMDIEEVAATRPDKIFNTIIDPLLGVQGFQSRRIGYALGLNGDQQKQLHKIIKALYQLFMDKDLSLIEINPLMLNKAGNLEALDAKVSIDDNALFRQANLEEWRDSSQEDEKESIAKRYDLNYVTLDGNIACMVNGAGLAMATMDIIKLHGGEPANFLDVGGGATAEKVAEAFKLIVTDKKVKAILVNIFGGIVRCDLIAEGVIKAIQEVGVNVPVVVRLEGTNVEAGKKTLAGSKLKIISADDLADAATKAVAAAGAKQQ
ncbi:MAG: succinate--CoA ligase subunit beta [Gammaproteobacteria bacterium RIFCSPLOWO2_02_FULL_47_50]|nr:MAG: succinate--CoA ligase subunit beta [Gammaproteobacteria bacterium RIFCSPLOWO2_02_47_7]OGT66679.1 MAG: succinate--CoA ligase subunit beta [Gammaproteobacteria bacterium RIFCSPLOWO2_01_FULL_47_190]OGT80093.1 MAG: succinate--CoA ligase subunit beta [Gammaproteobacteria bacterium RIFCSPLOWO2_02_FULL_47_50]OGT83005.1 MAG: succinate--CoA ligase subunit beta [Gammaproteobacteria bacterium RIFCSPLOWO2_12_FULL_47_76]